MKIALIGSGGREHAICKKISQSKLVKKIYCIPGNGGTEEIATNISLNLLDFRGLYKLIRANKIDLVIVGPEEPLVKGIVDFLRKKKIKVFGPNKYASKLEGSKAFMKSICKKKKIPTAKFKFCKNKKDVSKFISQNILPIVVKADGLAAGKGVTICKTSNEVFKFSNEIFNGKFKTSNKVILEEYLEGEEASYFAIVDQKSFTFFGSAQDHKKVGDKEKGPNTGGMGAYSPAPIITKDLEKKIISKIIKPTLSYLKEKKNAYTGFLYVGLMIKNNEPYLIEFNVRMGDPETQVIIPRLETDLVKIILNSLKNNLNKTKIIWKKNKCMTVVLCSKGYPGKYTSNRVINNLNKINDQKKYFIYHAGTIKKDNQIYTSGGRILSVTSSGKKFSKIKDKIYSALKKINFKHGFYRKDIGWRVT